MADDIEFLVDDAAWQHELQLVQELQNHEVVVGVLGEAGSDMINIAWWNHEGTKINGVEHIPARPFFDKALEDYGDEIDDMNARVMYAVLDLKRPIKPTLDLLGAFLVSKVQQTITDFDDPGNADSTIARKGFDNPLIGGGKKKGARIVGGRLRQSISHTVRLT